MSECEKAFQEWWRSLTPYHGAVTTRLVGDVAVHRDHAKAVWSARPPSLGDRLLKVLLKVSSTRFNTILEIRAFQGGAVANVHCVGEAADDAPEAALHKMIEKLEAKDGPTVD